MAVTGLPNRRVFNLLSGSTLSQKGSASSAIVCNDAGTTQTIAATTTLYTTPITTAGCEGVFSVFLDFTGSGTVTLSYELGSEFGPDSWTAPGAAGADGVILAAGTADADVPRLESFTPAYWSQLRFKIVTAADTITSVKLIVEWK